MPRNGRLREESHTRSEKRSHDRRAPFEQREQKLRHPHPGKMEEQQQKPPIERDLVGIAPPREPTCCRDRPTGRARAGG